MSNTLGFLSMIGAGLTAAKPLISTVTNLTNSSHQKSMDRKSQRYNALLTAMAIQKNQKAQTLPQPRPQPQPVPTPAPVVQPAPVAQSPAVQPVQKLPEPIIIKADSSSSDQKSFFEENQALIIGGGAVVILGAVMLMRK